MASQTFLGWQNYFASGYFTAGASAPGMGPAKLAEDQGSTDSAWQTPAGVVTSAAGAWFTCTFATPGSLSRLAGIFRTNLTPAASVTFVLTLGGVAVWTITVPGPPARYGQVAVVIPSDIAADWFGVYVDDPGNSDGFIHIPLAYCGPAWNPEIGFSWESTAGRNVSVVQRVSDGGQVFPDLKWTQRRFEMRLSGIRETEWIAQLDYLDAEARRGINVLVVPVAGSATLNQEACFGIVTPTADLSYPSGSGDARAWAARVEERL